MKTAPTFIVPGRGETAGNAWQEILNRAIPLAVQQFENEDGEKYTKPLRGTVADRAACGVKVLSQEGEREYALGQLTARLFAAQQKLRLKSDGWHNDKAMQNQIAHLHKAIKRAEAMTTARQVAGLVLSARDERCWNRSGPVHAFKTGDGEYLFFGITNLAGQYY